MTARRESRYSRPKANPPETFINHLVSKYTYATRAQWLSLVEEGAVWIERGRQDNPRTRRTRRPPPPHHTSSDASLHVEEATGGGAVIQSPTTDGDAVPTTSEPAPSERDLTLTTTTTIIRHAPHEVLLQGDYIVLDMPSSSEPDVDQERITILHVSDDAVVCVKNGHIPVAEGGRYCKNTLCAVLARWSALSWTPPPPQVTSRTALSKRERQPDGDDVPLQYSSREQHPIHASSSSISGGPSDAAGHCSPPTIGSLFPVHRLDRETSGIVAFGRNKSTAAMMTLQFAHHHSTHHHDDNGANDNDDNGQQVDVTALSSRSSQKMMMPSYAAQKEYEALLDGLLTMDVVKQQHALQQKKRGAQEGAADNADGITWLLPCDDEDALDSDGSNLQTQTMTERLPGVVIHLPIGSVLEKPDDIPEDQKQLSKVRMRCFPLSTPQEVGKYAKTELRIIGTDPVLNCTLVRIRLFTGRTHQIRLHCVHIGFPVLGDKLYATRTPGVPGGGCSVTDELYLRRARGQSTIQRPIQLQLSCGGSCLTTLAATVEVRRHMLHAFRLTLALPSKKNLVDVCETSAAQSKEDNEARLKDKPPIAASLGLHTFEHSSEPWFSSDLVVIPCDAQHECPLPQQQQQDCVVRSLRTLYAQLDTKSPRAME